MSRIIYVDFQNTKPDPLSRKEIRELAIQVNLLVQPSPELNYSAALGNTNIDNQTFLEDLIDKLQQGISEDVLTADEVAIYLRSQLERSQINRWYEES